MRVSKLYVRFFRSFNYDFERKADASAEVPEWEKIDGAWFPFIRVQLENNVTAVVGANESGKSHLIKAVKHALTGEHIDRSDFCRYSSLFSVETGQMRVPEFGLSLDLEDDADTELFSELGIPGAKGQSVILLRLNGDRQIVVDSSDEVHELEKEQLASIQAKLPRPFELETRVALPDSMSLDALIGRGESALSKRVRRTRVIELLEQAGPDESQIRDKAPELAAAMADPISSYEDEDSTESITPDELGRRLLQDVAKIGVKAFEDLEEALLAGQEGRVGGLLEQMNRSLSKHLNFSRWWRQDREFQLRLSPRERELVFTIRDRTGTDYSFVERSRGLTYFLSYYVQLRAHTGQSENYEVLLMDEPDAYLSSMGQQDLLRTLHNFARPEDGEHSNQVIYVTHSPFLIDKNAADHIRVLDKGSEEEGTRVVRDVARNHYEPLRSSIGTFVAETAFIGGENLVVEGVADQVLLAGMTTLLRRDQPRPSEILDLNDVTIVPAGSASSVPYMIYLARGRDELKPACVALLDGDEQGLDAIKKIARSNDGKRKPILDGTYVVNLEDWASSADLKVTRGLEVIEIEDLIPPVVAAAAARSYASRIIGLDDEKVAALDADLIVENLGVTGEGRVWRSVQASFEKVVKGGHIDKVGFAKEVIRYAGSSSDRRPSGVRDLESNFKALIGHLSDKLREAMSEETERRTNKRMDRIIRGFLRDHPEGAFCDQADLVLSDITSSLDDSDADEVIRRRIAQLSKSHSLKSDPLARVPNFDDFRQALEDLRPARRVAHREQ